ncbi:hypothetical protein HanIR_Chr13g0667091 [Helianthus annuus]|nr:hypothetical protein HanIR_Chr13g0667091 [Helianthus annuus]
MNDYQHVSLIIFFIRAFRAFTSNPSNYTYIPLKNNSYINIFPLKTNIFSLSFQLNNIIITFFSNFHSQSLSKYIKKL